MSAISFLRIFNSETDRRRTWVALITGAFLVVGISPMNAATDLLDDEDFLDEQVPIVLTATRLAQPRHDVPGSISIIDRKMIERSGATEIPELLRLVPGFQLGHASNRTAVTYHGDANKYSNRLQVLIDGRSVYTPVFGGVDWSDLPVAIEDVERLEVMRGPNGVTYGANAFTGVINIITRNPSVISGSEAKISVGNREYKRLYARHVGELGDSRYRINVESYSTSGFDDVSDDQQRNTFNFRDELRLGSKDLLDINAGYSSGPQDMGAGSVTSPYREKNITYHYQQLRWKRNNGPDDELNIQFYHNYHDIDDIFEVQVGFGPATAPYSLGTTMDRYDLELQKTQRISSELRIVYGGEVRADTVTSPDVGWFSNASSNSVTNNLTRLFLNGEWQASTKLLVNAGAMVERNDIVGTDVSPRLAFNYQLSKNETVRFIASRATRTPSVIESNADGFLKFQFGPVVDFPFIGNDKLEPETITSFEVGYFARYPSIKTTTDIRLYKETIKNRIEGYADAPFPGPPTSIQFSNNGDAEILGLDYELRYNPSKKTSVALAYAYAQHTGKYQTFLSSGIPTYDDTDDTTPTNTVSVLLSHELKNNLELSAGVYHVSEMAWITDNGVGSKVDEYTTVDIRAAKEFELKGMKGKAALTVQNANDDYSDYDASVEINRFAYLSVGLHF